MARGTSSTSKRGTEESEETSERKRLRKLAFENRILSDSPVRCSAPLKPSKQVVKHHGKDIIRRSQRKNRFLFSFPGLLAPISGGKIGELDKLSTKNPVLYVDFPQGRMKLFGTIMYPKNKYLTMQFSRGGKNVTCEDYFDHMIVFSEVWWIGTKEENPDENRLEVPQELTQGQQTEFDFKGGVGAVSVNTQRNQNPIVEKEPRSPEAEFSINLSDDGDEESQENKIQVTPIRQSGRIAGKKFNYTETSPEDVSDDNDSSTSEEEAKIVVVKPVSSVEIDKLDQASAPEGSKTKKTPTPSAVKKEKSSSGDGLLVQATLSTLFKKAEEKATGSSRKSPAPKDS